MAGRVIATIISEILQIKVYDTQCGCKVFSRDLASEVFIDEFISRWLFDVEIFFEDHCFESEATPEWYSHNRDLKAPPPPPPQTKFYHCMLCDKYCNNCKELIANHLKIYHTPEEIKEFYSQKRPRK